MSLIALTAPLIRLAVVDDGYAQDLFEAVETDEESRSRLVDGPVQGDDLDRLTLTEWQWYANWRQARGGGLDQVLLDHLTASVTTRFARFEVRALVLRDRRTNELAPEYDSPPDGTDVIGLRWLSAQAQGQRIDGAWVLAMNRRIEDFDVLRERARSAPDDEALQEVASSELFDEAFQERWEGVRDDEALELATDALQCATDASWFLLRQLLLSNDDEPWPPREERRALVKQRLDDFAETRGLNPQWYERGQPLRNE